MPLLMPKTCVCTAPATPVLQISLLTVFMLGLEAVGGVLSIVVTVFDELTVFVLAKAVPTNKNKMTVSSLLTDAFTIAKFTH